MSDDILKSYPHAMIMDPETGKPMMKVHTQGGSGGGGGEVTFPEDFPDLETQSILVDIRENTQGLNSNLQTIASTLQSIDSKLSGIVNGDVVLNVKVITEEVADDI